ncbi:patatin family protein [Radiobacillus kanasensis]|uniref:patatin-like phospholipase family protein n=1 Tax=Radiobacillus kanasensis TaxID=2844358 RepID=UPI001E59EEEB|nr:patatin family protein [Radiobacillus kanasensis]UFT99975.1 patatin family protein [Radiobacillus kanasensis]
MKEAGLVLEGGGMRGVYTAGVLEYFMEQRLYFPYVIGVSAGACMAASYLSRQLGRNRAVNIDFAGDKRYLSWRNFIRKRELFGMDFIFDEIPNQLVPFDYDAFLKSSEQLVVGTTDCETGEPVYYGKDRYGEDMLKILRASSSLPFVAPAVPFEDRALLDGGIVDPIPIKKAQQDGFDKNVVVLTKPAGYFKNPPGRLSSLFKYKQHPKINERIETRYQLYNDTLDYMEEEEIRGNVFVMRPSVSMPVGRVEKDKNKLVKLYELGWKDAEAQFEKLKDFLEIKEESISSK